MKTEKSVEIVTRVKIEKAKSVDGVDDQCLDPPELRKLQSTVSRKCTQVSELFDRARGIGKLE